MKALALAALMPPAVQLSWCSTTHHPCARAGQPQPGCRPLWGNSILPGWPGLPRGGLRLRAPTHSTRASSLSLAGPPAATSRCRRRHGASPGLLLAAPAPPRPAAGTGGRVC